MRTVLRAVAWAAWICRLLLGVQPGLYGPWLLLLESGPDASPAFFCLPGALVTAGNVHVTNS